ncbi:medium-chain acyl-CoA synthetase [Syntrophotalea carbinolica DSM 2380]|uniref:Medium-chain acyl-CoA synthetase n=1 Tax=Syntrophotalea carbinolica (strain DSM 2380 / NBRC 103641 / GraBd1) TaxID=338963 RepID=Q3A566_SYNC1|nr:AMP-binding protein [Syntrophotalea carbinolica]ABA88491.1 medium-chain acyl-CoA synthetase [Syntrophotalea carbinolica DSM 2380]
MSCLLDRFVNRTEFNSYKDFKSHLNIKIPDNFNFAYDVVDVYAAEQPEKRALVWCDDHGNDRTFTFGDLKHYSDKAANLFRSYGIKKGDHVMLILKGRYEFWFCLLGLHKIGAIATPATHMLTSKDIKYRVEVASIPMIVSVADDGLVEHIEEGQRQTGDRIRHKLILGEPRDGWLDFKSELEKASADFVRPEGNENTCNDDTCLAYFSSGTTGYPKLIHHDMIYPLGHILTAKYWQNNMDDGLHYTVADTGWAKVVWGKIYGQWLCGSAVFVYDYDKFNAASMAAMAARYGVTTFCAPPTIYRFLIKEDLSQYDFSGLKYCVVAGEPLNPEVYERFLKYTGLKLMEAYGQTELVVTIATWPWMEPKPGSMGKPCPLYDIDLLNAEGRPCDVGEEGEIVINTKSGRPLGLFPGYFRDEDKTAEVWYDGYYHTGDMAWRDEDGYYWFVGRADDVIKSSGYRIGPFEVESALMEHPAVMECAITGVPDPDRGQVVKATIVLTKDFTADDTLKEKLQNHVKNVTAPYKYPRIIEFVPELPKTISGKIRRVEIREKDDDRI